MKVWRSIQFLLLLITSISLWGTENFSVSRRYIDAGHTKFIDEVIYYDGLGRPVETIQRGISPSGQSIIALQEYDAQGRMVKSWLPVVGDGSFMSSTDVAVASQALYSDPYGYTTTIYQKSPSATIEGTIRPGKILAGTKISSKVYVNDGSTEFGVTRFTVGSNGAIANDGLWPDGVLSAEKTVDEDGRTSITFTDHRGRKLLTRQLVQAGSYADTYYVFDCYGDLRYIVPPLASDKISGVSASGGSWTADDDVIDAYCYYYEKNILGQTTLFKKPGQERTVYRYDGANRLTLIQNGNQRQDHKWSFVFSDYLGREAILGECILTDAEANAILADSHTAKYTGNGDIGGYEIDGNTAREDTFFKADIINYFDSYSFIPQDRLTDFVYTSTPYSDKAHSSAMGRQTGSQISGKLSVVYYDIYGNKVQTHTDNHLGYTDSEYCTYTYSNRPNTIRTVTHIVGDRTITQDLRYTYDDKNRTTAIYHKLDEGDEICIQKNTYNELGLLQSQNAGSEITQIFTYDMQGRITGTESTVFSSILEYETEGCMAGNISSQTWTNGANREEKYTYTYDLLNHLTAANYTGTQSGLYSTTYTYDKMANPISVKRYALGTKRPTGPNIAKNEKVLVDNLTYTYNGHHLKRIIDGAFTVNAVGSLDFDMTSASDYEYDSNGNIAFDPNRDMYFTYDRNDMPQTIYRTSTESTTANTADKIDNTILLAEYSYDAAATRQSVTHHIPAVASSIVGGILVAGKPARTLRRDYVGECVLLDSVLERILIPGGYIDNRGRYYFYITDYQGNNRVVISRAGSVAQRTDYYPYGLPLRQVSPDAQPYTYSGKEFDLTNGLNTLDFHARAFFPDHIRFGSPDRKAVDYTQISTYAYCAGNPVIYRDPSGDDLELVGANNSSVTFTTDLIDKSFDMSSFGIDWGGNYNFQGEDLLSAGLDLVGIVDPTGVADGLNCALQAKNGDYGGAAISLASMIPFVGDMAKAGKIGKDIKIIESAIDAARQGEIGVKVVHANSKASTKAQHLYVIIETETGKAVKVGVSSGRISRLGKSYRATSQVNKLNKKAGYIKYDTMVIDKVPAGPGARDKILKKEKNYADRLREKGEIDSDIHKRP